MVKKVSKVMTILTLVGAGVVGVNSAELVATNVKAYETSSTKYFSIKWETDRLMVKSDGGTFQDNFGELVANKSAIYGSKDIYINLKGTYNLYFSDHHNKQYQNYIYGDIYADSIMFDTLYIYFYLNGECVGEFDLYELIRELNSENFYIFRCSSDETYSTVYLSIYWDLWDFYSSEQYLEMLMVSFGGTYYYDFRYLVMNTSELFGSNDVYINLGASNYLTFVDSVVYAPNNNVYGGVRADAIILRDEIFIFLLNADIVLEIDNSTILDGLGNPTSYYIVRASEVDYDIVRAYDDGYNHGYDDGYDKGLNDGQNIGYDNGRDYYGIVFNGNWRTAEWYGNYMYDKGLNETDATGFRGLLAVVFGGLGDLLAIQLLPGIYIGAIIAVPLVFGIIFFILGKRKGD